MNAALEMLKPIRAQFGGVGPTRGDEIIALECQALRRGSGVATEVIEKGNDAPAKLRNTREGVYFASAVDGKQGAMGIQLHHSGIKTPLWRLLGFRQLGDEAIERHVPIASTGIWVMERRVKGRGVACVPHSYDPRIAITAIACLSGVASLRAIVERARGSGR